MKHLRSILLASVLSFGISQPAQADPISLMVGAVVALTAGGLGATTALAIGLGVAVAGMSYLAKSLMPSINTATTASPLSLGSGEDVAQQFPFGYTGIGGSLVYINSWGKDGKTPNAYCTKVIALSDLPVGGLIGIWDGEQSCTLAGNGKYGYNADLGWPITEYMKDGEPYLWVKFYDGSQNSADSFLVSKFQNDSERPYLPSRIGYGRAYAIITARKNDDVFSSGFPKLIFVVNGAKIYDQRKDATCGGHGVHRADNPSTWEATTNPQVIRNHVRRGIYYAGQWVYGLQSMSAYRLPFASWAAAANDCDIDVEETAGVFVPQYRCGGTIMCDAEPASVDESLMRACNARHIDVGGIYKTTTGVIGSPVLSITDDQFIITEEQTYDQYVGIAETINGVTATYPSPDEGWESKEAPALKDETLIARDGRELIADVKYDCVPYPGQVQRLMKSALAEERRWRSHTGVLPHTVAASGIEPGDVLAWTSTRNGYNNKLFRIESMKKLANLDWLTMLKEADPSDYDWDPESDYIPTSSGSISKVTVPSQDVSDLSVTAVVVAGQDGSETPAIKFQWDTDGIDDVVGMNYQIRKSSDGSAVADRRATNFVTGFVLQSEGIAGLTSYECRAQYEPGSNRECAWSVWYTVTTAKTDIPDGSVTGVKIADAAIDPVAKFIAGMDAIKVVTAAALPTTKITNTIFWTVTSKLYTWDTTSAQYKIKIDTSDLTGSIVATQIADASLTTAKFAAGIEPVSVAIGSLPTTKTTSTIYYSNKLYRWDQATGAYVATVQTNDLAGYVSGTQIAPATITASNIASGAITSTLLAPAAVDVTKFASGLTPVEIVATLPVSGNFDGRTVFLTSDGQLYRYKGGWTAAVPAVNVTGTVVGSQIASATVTGTNIAANTIAATNIIAGAITASKLTITPGNQIMDPSFQDPAYWAFPYYWTISTNAAACAALGAPKVAASPAIGTPYQGQDYFNTAVNGGWLPMLSGASYAIGFDQFTKAGYKGQVFIEVIAEDSAGNVLGFLGVPGPNYFTTACPADIVEHVSGIVTMPAGTTVGNVTIYSNNPGGGTAQAYVGSPRVVRATDGNLLVNGCVTAAAIAANTITAGQIAAGTITTTQIAAGTIVAANIASGAITTSKLAVFSQGAALNADPSCSDATAWVDIGGNGSPIFATVSDGQVGNAVIRSRGTGVSWFVCREKIAIDPTKTYRFRHWSRHPVGSDGYLFGVVRLFDKSGTQVGDRWLENPGWAYNPSATWTSYSAVFGAGTTNPLPTNAGSVSIGGGLNYAGTSGYMEMQDIRLEEVLPATLIQDGCITTTKIAASTITATNIAAAAIGTTQLAAGSVTASKVLIAPGNQIFDPTFADVSYWQLSSTSLTISTNATACAALGAPRVLSFNLAGWGPGYGAHALAANIPMAYGAAYQFAFDTYVTAGFTGQLQLYFFAFDKDGNITGYPEVDGTNYLSVAASGNLIEHFSGIVKPPVGTVRADLYLNCQGSGTITNAGVGYIGTPKITRASDASLIVDGSIIAAKIAAGTITATQIAADTITSGQIASGAISTDELAANAVTAVKIAAGTITADKLVASSITGSQIAANTITAAQMAVSGFTANMITTGTLNAGVVNITNLNASSITAGTITATQLQVGAANSVGSLSSVTYQVTGTETTIASLTFTPTTSAPIDISVLYGLTCNAVGIDDTEFKIKVSGGKFAHDAPANWGYGASTLVITRKILASQFLSNAAVVDSVLMTEIPYLISGNYQQITVIVTARKTGGTYSGVFPCALINVSHPIR